MFTFYLFQSISMGRDYSFSIASLSFLSEHGFNFNKVPFRQFWQNSLDDSDNFRNNDRNFVIGYDCISFQLTREGISHMNLDELQRVLERFHQPNGIE